MAQQTHTPVARATFHVHNRFEFQAAQPGMRKEERDGNTGNTVRAIPVVRQPEVWSEAKTALFQFTIQLLDAWFQPGTLNSQIEIADARIQQLFLRPASPLAVLALCSHCGFAPGSHAASIKNPGNGSKSIKEIKLSDPVRNKKGRIHFPHAFDSGMQT